MLTVRVSRIPPGPFCPMSALRFPTQPPCMRESSEAERDIPIYQATKFELLINQKTAKAFTLTLLPRRCSRAPTK